MARVSGQGELTPLAVAVLALLFERPMHPYEMYQLLLARREDRLVKIRPGSLYHTVERLDRDGHVQSVGIDRCGRRPERTTFEVTDGGRAALTAWIRQTLEQPRDEYPHFPLAVAEAHNLPKREVVTLLRRRSEHLAARRDGFVGAMRDADGDRVPRMFLLDLEHAVAVAEAELRWTDQVIERLESGELEWLNHESGTHAACADANVHTPVADATITTGE